MWRTSSFSGATGNCVEVDWRKSSQSSGNGNCVEVGWRKSSRSTGANGSCVEAADHCGRIHVRDTKDREGGELQFGYDAWTAFTHAI